MCRKRCRCASRSAVTVATLHTSPWLNNIISVVTQSITKCNRSLHSSCFRAFLASLLVSLGWWNLKPACSSCSCSRVHEFNRGGSNTNGCCYIRKQHRGNRCVWKWLWRRNNIYMELWNISQNSLTPSETIRRHSEGIFSSALRLASAESWKIDLKWFYHDVFWPG